MKRLTSGNVFHAIFVSLKLILFTTQEGYMKQWFVSNILSTDNMQTFESGPISDKEFTISITMLFIALALFGFVVRVFGA